MRAMSIMIPKICPVPSWEPEATRKDLRSSIACVWRMGEQVVI
jgi:hypothetical protein